MEFPTKGDNTLDLFLTNKVSFLNKFCDIPGLGYRQSTIFPDIEYHPKKQKPFILKDLCLEKMNYYVNLSNKIQNRLLQPVI